MRWARKVLCVGYIINAYKILVGRPERRDDLGELRLDGMIILKWVSEK
jgi:hypothetical protein